MIKKHTCGVSSGRRVLYTREDSSLPPDIRNHKSTDGTTTWYSNAEGDSGGFEYLRRYGNGTYAIHIMTWCTKENLEKSIDSYKAMRDSEWLNLHREAITELERRIKATSGETK